MCLYKGQASIYFFMGTPNEKGEYMLGLMPFQTFLVAIFCAKLLHMLDILYVQARVPPHACTRRHTQAHTCAHMHHMHVW